VGLEQQQQQQQQQLCFVRAMLLLSGPVQWSYQQQQHRTFNVAFKCCSRSGTGAV
jgi:hypothetical protein